MVIQERTKLLKPIARDLNLVQVKDTAFKIVEQNGFITLINIIFDYCSSPDDVALIYSVSNLFVKDIERGIVLGHFIIKDKIRGSMSRNEILGTPDLIKNFFREQSDEIDLLSDIPRCLANGILPSCSAPIWRYFNLGCVYLAMEQYDNAKEELLAILDLDLYPNLEFIKICSKKLLQHISKKEYVAIRQTLLLWQNENIDVLKLRKVLEKHNVI